RFPARILRPVLLESCRFQIVVHRGSVSRHGQSGFDFEPAPWSAMPHAPAYAHPLCAADEASRRLRTARTGEDHSPGRRAGMERLPTARRRRAWKGMQLAARVYSTLADLASDDKRCAALQ